MSIRTHFLQVIISSSTQWLRYVLLLFILFLWTSIGFSQDCLERDSIALVALYNATDGANWSKKWLLDTPLEDWHGVNNTGSTR